MIKELDIIVLKQDRPKEHLQAGDVGTVVMVHGEGVAYQSNIWWLNLGALDAAFRFKQRSEHAELWRAFHAQKVF